MRDDKLSQAAARRARLAEDLFPLPDGLASEEELCRLTHADIPLLTRAQIESELARLRLRLTLEVEPPEWLLVRQRMLERGIRDVP
jgi:hypothetical protein